MSTLNDIGDTLVAAVKSYLGDQACRDYGAIFRSMGLPPLECNQIAVWMRDSERNPSVSNRCADYRIETWVIQIARCCPAIESQEAFPFDALEKEAACFYRDIQLIDECLTCSIKDLLDPFTVCRDDAVVLGVQPDGSRQGGCYASEIWVQYKRPVCCPEEE